ncbi:MAG: SdpI family protein [Allosphingosinicella sp.]|uniref:SdpI family protein n=1 Tax=Allosphingosinicella sp. TaxID=2823234 RepID=UPI00394F863C
MTQGKMIALSAAVLAAMLASALWVASRLPADALLPIHWDAYGRADGFAGKWTALLMMPAITAFSVLLFWAIPKLEPKREGLERSQGLYLWGWAAVLLTLGTVHLAVLGTALGLAVPVARLVAGSVGLMLVLIGNQLGKSRRMYMVGFRTPWTLASEEVWIKTHRLAGKLMVAGGAAVLAAALIGAGEPLLIGLLLLAVLIGVAVPLVYSYLLWRREQADQPRG